MMYAMRKKCDFNYFKDQSKSELIKTLINFGVSIAILVLGMVITKIRNPEITLMASKNNLLTVAAVLGLLPAGRFLVSYIMFLKAKKHSCPKELHEKITNIVSEKLIVRYDLYMTTYDNNFSLYSLTVAEDCIIGVTDDKSFKANEYNTHIKSMLAKNGLKIGTIKIFDNDDKYLSRLNQIINNGYEQTEKDMEVIRLMENLSL